MTNLMSSLKRKLPSSIGWNPFPVTLGFEFMTRKNFKHVLVLRILPKTSFKFLSTAQSSAQCSKKVKI